MHMKKDKQVLSQVFNNVSNDFIWYGTSSGSFIRTSRFHSPIEWTGIVVSAQVSRSYDFSIETGIKIKRVSLFAGIDSQKIYGKLSLRLW